MKKLVFLFVAFVAVSFASCGNKAAIDAAASDSDSVAVVEESAAVDTVDSLAADSAATDSAVVAE